MIYVRLRNILTAEEIEKKKTNFEVMGGKAFGNWYFSLGLREEIFERNL